MFRNRLPSLLFISFVALLVSLAFWQSNGTLKKKDVIRTELLSFEGVAMTIPYRILIGHPLQPDQSTLIEGMIRETFEYIDQVYNKWNPESEISLFNRYPAGIFFPASDELLSFLNKTDTLVALTKGRFDPTVETVQKVWRAALNRGVMPEEEELASCHLAMGWDGILLTEGSLAKKNSLTQIDLGGIAKGYCVDLFAAKFKERGLSNFLIDWGGELIAAGCHPSGREWNIAIRGIDLRPSAVATTPLKNVAIACSGDYYQFWAIENKGIQVEFFHIVDPATGYLLERKKGSIASACVTAPTCMEADAIATAMMLCSSVEEADSWARELHQQIPQFTHWVITRP